jgi:peptidoglycan-associated lipoprotein
MLIMTAACAKKAPVAANTPPPPDITPVARPAENAKPLATRTPAPAPAAVKQAAPQAATRPTTLTPQERTTINEALARLSDALFDYDKAAIRDDARTALSSDVNVIRDILSNYPQQKLLIEGHADERGSDEYNLALGDRRARPAEEFLTTMGIPNNQLSVMSFGKNRPVCTEATEACWQKNRRAHMTAAP